MSVLTSNDDHDSGDADDAEAQIPQSEAAVNGWPAPTGSEEGDKIKNKACDCLIDLGCYHWPRY